MATIRSIVLITILIIVSNVSNLVHSRPEQVQWMNQWGITPQRSANAPGNTGNPKGGAEKEGSWGPGEVSVIIFNYF